MFDFAGKFSAGLPYAEFLQQHGTPEQRERWQEVFAQVSLTPPQTALLGTFRREMKVLCLAGAWCGDCVQQCPIFERFCQATPVLQVRYFDRDLHADLQAELSLCGGKRVPVLVFLNEDGQFCGMAGDRTLSRYRDLARQQLGPSCPSGVGIDASLLAAVTQDWLNEFERIQLMLRLSARLRQKHGD